MKPVRILFHGFGAFPLFLKPLVLESRPLFPEIDWTVVLTSGHHLDLMTKLLGNENVYLLPAIMRQYYKDSEKPEDLVNYSGNIFLDIESDKSPLKKLVARRQFRNALAVYKSYQRILDSSKATHVLFGHCESHEGKILAAVAREKNIQVISYAHARNLGESFFFPDVTENLPSHAKASQDDIKKAETFVALFRKQNIPAGNMQPVINYLDSERYIPELKSKWLRITDYIIQLFSEPDVAHVYGFYYRFVNSFPFIRDRIWNLRKKIASLNYNIRDFSDLPEKFIYYPMQYTPESSINIPAPYFVDQRRAIDLIRFNMPSNYRLVVKEHPSCISVRPLRIMRSLRRCAGVVIANYKMDSMELVKRASLTVSVTGTATLEAFLLGKSSLNLGDTFFSELLGGKCELCDISGTINKAIERKLTDSEIVSGIARIFSVTAPFLLTSPEAGEAGKITMSKENIRTFVKQLARYIEITSVQV